MEIRSGKEELYNNLFRQLSLYWQDINYSVIKKYVPCVLDKLKTILCNISKDNKYIWKNYDAPTFTPMHSVQYAIFLYLLSNILYKNGQGDTKEADCIYYLNKIMHSCDWYYAIDLPDIFYAEHPLGSVLGRAEYGNRFFFYQGCTVGGNRSKSGELCYPKIGDNVLMYANSSILGKSLIGNNVILSAGTMVVGDIIPDNSIVFGRSPELVIKVKSQEEILDRQKHLWIFKK